jgi:peptide/nickel transport system substrate-binding protein
MTISRRSLLAGTAAAVATVPFADLSLAQTAGARRILIMAAGQDIPNFDPHVTTGFTPAMAMRNMYDSLVRIEGNPPQPVPHLARSWTISPDGMTYEFKLNTAARFHDGSPVDAAAVKYSFDRILKLRRGNSWMVSGVLDATSVQVIDAETVRIRLSKPFVAFLQVLVWQWIVNPRVVEANLGTDDGQTFLRANAAASGAFRLRRAEAGNLYEWERVGDNWRQGGGNLTGAILRIVRETSNQRLMVQRGEVHVSLDLTSEDMDSLKDRPGVVSIIEPEFRTFSIKMNTEHGPLADVELRKAVSYAFDYQAMLATAGYADLMQGPLPNGIFGHDTTLEVYRTNLERARAHLARSRSPNGAKIEMTPITGLEQQRRWALILAESLRRINIELEIKPSLWPDMLQRARTPQTAPDFFPVYQTANYGDPDNIAFAAYHSTNNGNWQNMVYKNPAVDKIIEDARAETDVEKRRALYHRFQRMVVDDAPDLFGVLEKRKIAMRDTLQNFRFVPVASNALEFFPLSLRS